MVPLDKLAWARGDRSYFQAQMSEEEDCSSSCLKDCNCWAASYDQNSMICTKQQPPLRYAKRIQGNEEVPSLKFFKVRNLNLNNVSSEPVPEILGTINSSRLLIRVLKYKRLLEIGDLGLNEEVALRRFSYTELKRATNGFKQELGKGSFGAVYKGVLYKAGRCRRFIAVKRLEKLVEDGEREFQAEVRAIGKTHHRNLVRLLGFCAEGPKRLLVYEYMSNGSLGKLLFGDERLPDWDERVRIALDIARGILYLHEECEAPIIHCDIKPQNILMDEFWTAKISDFGLAKLLMPDQTRTFTGVRGTRGYLAPEWNKNTPITVKADIYSYGIVLLETVCCRRNLDVNVSEPNEILLSGWAYKCFVAGEVHKLVHWEEVDKNVVENMVKVALWCIQDEPVLRPSMKSVVLMLEGVTDVPVPPCPTSNSM
ncbi:G-type lectin S-receptor-like serine/threonine-protein kinase [Arachis hypogaea]|nr:G-type lectin S-receptor-like serine/threonine-protein kinase [Arachis hypogaea]